MKQQHDEINQYAQTAASATSGFVYTGRNENVGGKQFNFRFVEEDQE